MIYIKIGVIILFVLGVITVAHFASERNYSYHDDCKQLFSLPTEQLACIKLKRGNYNDR